MGKLLVSAFLSIPLIGAFAMFALGLVVIYRASRVLNLAHGAMAMFPAYIFYTLRNMGLPLPIALPLGVLSGSLLGVAVEWGFVRRLRRQGPTAQTVGTVAVTGLLIALVAKVYGTTPLQSATVFPDGVLRVGGAGVQVGALGLLAVGLAVSAGMFAFFQFTEIGLAMRGAAQNRTAAVLMGVDPNRAASAAWAMGGGLAALAGILLAALTNLSPYTLSLQVLPAFVAALIGGLESLLGAVVGSLVAGFAFGLVPALNEIPLVGRVTRLGGSPQLVLTVLALVVMVTRGRRFSGSDSGESGLAAGGAAFARRAKLGPLAVIGFASLFVWPWIAPYSALGSSLLAVEFALAAVSLVVLTGWVGQISLAQASFVGIGALITAMVTRGTGLTFPMNIVVGALAGAAVATLLGAVALRVRGLYLAVATLIFAWMADSFLFPSPWLGAGEGSSTIPSQRIGREGGIPSLDLTSRRTVYLLLVTVLVLVVFALANLRDTRTGRAFAAVRGSEMAAASLGIDVVRYKLIAFALSGALAGLSGALLMVEQRTVVPGSQFIFTMSLQYLAIAVVGGLGSLGGAVGAGVLFAGLNELFFRVKALSGWLEVVSALLLAVVLLVYPGGLAAAAAGIRELVERSPVGALWQKVDAELRKVARAAVQAVKEQLAMTRRAPAEPAALDAETDWYAAATAAARAEAPADEPTAEPDPDNGNVLSLHTGLAARRAEERDGELRTLLEASNITVRFGGLTAVSDASLVVREGEIVGLIGPNGAGKTTLFNAILGLNEPADGTVVLYGKDVTSWEPHQRARLGVARTFQVLQLFNDLTVFDNLLVATHLHNKSGLFSNLAASERTLGAEFAARQRVRDVLRIMKLDGVANEYVRNLPFGVLRMVELGRALVTGAKLMLLDEAASGLNDAETNRLVEVVRGVRDLGVSVLLIEHDVRMVTDVSDYVYVLDQGKMLAEGKPDDVRRNPRVVTAYLGAADPAPAPTAEHGDTAAVSA